MRDLVLLFASPSLEDRLRRCRKLFADAELVVLYRGQPPVLRVGADYQVKFINDYKVDSGRRVKVVFEPAAPMVALRFLLTTARRETNQIECFLPTGEGSLESAALV